jgi:hypothetical protein
LGEQQVRETGGDESYPKDVESDIDVNAKSDEQVAIKVHHLYNLPSEEVPPHYGCERPEKLLNYNLMGKADN